jgi:hypothetical protein
MKRIFFLICITFFYINIFGQDILDDVVYLKDGSIIRGLIIEQVPNTSVKIRTGDKNVFTISIKDIEKFTKEEPAVKFVESLSRFKQKGYQNVTEIGILAGVGLIQTNSPQERSYQNDEFDFSLSTVNGWLINSNVFTGIGIGIEKDHNDYRLPLYLDTRFILLKSTITPFVYTDMGYAWGWNSDAEGSDWGGILLSFGLGVGCHLTRTSSLLFSVGYKIQQIKLEYFRWFNNGVRQYEYDISFSNLLGIKLGFSF